MIIFNVPKKNYSIKNTVKLFFENCFHKHSQKSPIDFYKETIYNLT